MVAPAPSGQLKEAWSASYVTRLESSGWYCGSRGPDFADCLCLPQLKKLRIRACYGASQAFRFQELSTGRFHDRELSQKIPVLGRREIEAEVLRKKSDTRGSLEDDDVMELFPLLPMHFRSELDSETSYDCISPTEKKKLRTAFKCKNEGSAFSPAMLHENVSFLKEMGVNEQHMSSLTRKCPAVLTVNLKELLMPLVQRVQELCLPKKVIGNLLKFNAARVLRIRDTKISVNMEFFRSLGLSGGQIVRIGRGNPQVLVMDVEADFKPTIDFLLRLGLEMPHVRKVVTVFPTVLGLRVEQNLETKIKYLEAIGVTPSNLGKVIARCPPVLGFSLDNLAVKVDYLHRLGISTGTVKAMVERCPAILGYSIEKNVEPKIRYLESIGVEPKNVSKIIGSCPTVLGYSIKRNLQPKIDFFKSIGVDEYGLNKVITSSPVILSYSLDRRLKPTVKFLTDIGFSDDRIPKLIITSPSVFSSPSDGKCLATLNFFSKLGMGVGSTGMTRAFTSCFSNSIETLEARLVYLTSCGFSISEVHEMVNAQPALLSLSDQNLHRKIEFLKQSTDISELKRSNLAKYLTYSLESRMKPRHELMSCMKSRGVLRADFQFTTILELPEKKYQDRFIQCHLPRAEIGTMGVAQDHNLIH